MEKDDIEIKKSHQRAISIQSFLFFNENVICEEKSVKDNNSNVENDPVEENANIVHFSYETNVNPQTQKEETIVMEHPVEPTNQNKLYDLKESTRKLLCLLDKILLESETTKVQNETPKITVNPIQPHEEDGKCTIYNRLTRKCQCLNNPEYNDFTLLFNENVKHTTCDTGEIIKNLRILKKFLYMGDGYTTNALIFLNEGLSESTLSEKSDIVQGCIQADICNVFEDHSIVTSLITWSRKFNNYGDQMAQVMTAQMIYKIARTEEGKRYLNYNSKITYDIKYALKKYATNFNNITLEPLNATLELLQQHFNQNLSLSYYCKPINKGVGVITLLNLTKCRSPMPLEEMILNLELLNNLSNLKRGKLELKPYLPDLLKVLKRILKQYDSSEINIVATNLIKNVISKSMLKNNSLILNNKVMVRSTATEPNEMKNVIVQVNEKKPKKHRLKSDKKLYLSAEQGKMFELPIINEMKEVFDKTRRQIIVIPSK